MSPEDAADFAELQAAYGGKLFGGPEAERIGVSARTLVILVEAGWLGLEHGFRVRCAEEYPRVKRPGELPRLRHESGM